MSVYTETNPGWFGRLGVSLDGSNGHGPMQVCPTEVLLQLAGPQNLIVTKIKVCNSIITFSVKAVDKIFSKTD